MKEFDIELESIKSKIKNCYENLPKRVDPANISTIAKTPYKATVYRECLFYRHTDLANTAHNLFSAGEYLPAFIITRSAMECTGMLFWAQKKMINAMRDKDLDEVDTFFKRALVGERINDALILSHNATTGIKHISKKVKHFTTMYDELSEYLHPNYSGTTYSYSQADYDNMWTDLGFFVTKLDPRKGSIALEHSLILFEHFYNSFSDDFEGFVKFCENELHQA